MLAMQSGSSTTPERAELVEELCSFTGRRAGSDAERRAANRFAAHLRQMGRRVSIEPTYVHSDWALVLAAHCAIACIGSVVTVTIPVLGFALVLLAATSLYLDLNARFYLLRSLFFRRGSQNVVSPGRRPEAPMRIVLCANLDAPRTGLLNGHRFARLFARLSRLTGLPWTATRVIFWSVAFLVPVTAAQAAGLDSDGLALLQVIPTLLLLIGAFAYFDVSGSGISPGANQDASGVAAVLSLADRLDAAPPEALDVWVLLTGGRDALSEGMRGFAKAHRELERETTLFICLDSVGAGEVRYLSAEGPAVSFAADRRLTELCDAVAEADRASGDELRAAPLVHGFSSDAHVLRIAKRRAISITCLEPDRLVPRNARTRDDVPAALDPLGGERAERFCLQLIGAIDREAARRQPESGRRSTLAGAATRS